MTIAINTEVTISIRFFIRPPHSPAEPTATVRYIHKTRPKSVNKPSALLSSELDRHLASLISCLSLRTATTTTADATQHHPPPPAFPCDYIHHMNKTHGYRHPQPSPPSSTYPMHTCVHHCSRPRTQPSPPAATCPRSSSPRVRVAPDFSNTVCKPS